MLKTTPVGIALLLVLSTAAISSDASLAKDRAPKPIAVLHGANSKIVKERMLRVLAEKEWKDLWSEHKLGVTDKKAMPRGFEYLDFDFDKVMIIAIFAGKGCCCDGFTCHSINERRDRIVVQVHSLTYQVGIASFPSRKVGEIPETQAWGILVLPRSNKEVVLERDVRDLIEDPPKWDKWVTFPSVKEEVTQLPSEKLWESIATIPFPKVAPHHLPRSGSTKWCVGKLEAENDLSRIR
jgi:hypothetical protein